MLNNEKVSCSLPQRPSNRFRSVKRRRRIRKKAREIISEKKLPCQENKTGLLSILSLVAICFVLVYFKPN